MCVVGESIYFWEWMYAGASSTC